MRRIIIYISITMLIFLTGCGSNYTAASKQDASLYKNSDFEISRLTDTVNINIDSGNVQIYCWDEKKIKLESKHTVRDYKTPEGLENLLKKYSIETSEQNKIFTVNIKYKASIRKDQDIYTDLKLTLPKRIKNLNINQQSGSFIIEDKYEGNLTARFDSVNSEIKTIKGQVNIKCSKGNTRVNSGKLSNGSYIDVESGNIFIKGECQEQSNYAFRTQAGNIKLFFPLNSDMLIESFGTVQNNQFSGVEGSIKVEAYAKMGKISVDGY